jgi:hypothetical protein
VSWPLPFPEPADLRALYAFCDGLTLDDGFSLLGKGELGDVTRWLLLEKGLDWAPDIIVVGERRDVVVVLDLDVRGIRAGGGVLETTVDALEAFERRAGSLVGYLLVRAAAVQDDAPPPEVAAPAAVARADAAALERELARPMYPGSDRLFAHLALELGKLWAARDDADRALSAFEQSVTARERMVGVAARADERAAGWRAAAHAARACGAEAIAARCDEVARRVTGR